MAVVCPTITATSLDQFKNQIEQISQFATRAHLDITDGFFAPALLNVNKIRLPDILVDIHAMYEYPSVILDQLIELKPHMIIIHYESAANFKEISKLLRSKDIKFGVALLQQTDSDALDQFKNDIDHVLIFSGNLGFFGGSADMELLKKAEEIKKLNPKIEIGWDGGINLSNAKTLVDHSVDVLDVGGFIHKSSDPKKAYLSLVESIGAKK